MAFISPLYAFQSSVEEKGTSYFEGRLKVNHSNGGRLHMVSEMLFQGDQFRIKFVNPLFANERGFEIPEVVFNTKSLKRARINLGGSTVEYLAQQPVTENNKSDVEITDEWKDFLGYRCRKYIVTKENANFAIKETFVLWVTDEIKINNLSSFSLFSGWETYLSYAHELDDGLVLRRELLNERGKIEALVEVTEIILAEIDPIEFKIPTEAEGYQIIGSGG
ncbi:hypothetical protein [Roseivirga sp. E12]|uniref:hypothetical protein n=1 Tax=Roseivirga sp. E12 TaxID=2819237 RepID=UPI001ABCC4F3|nr:hypothetical protein [Roseivirga sp. E12]